MAVSLELKDIPLFKGLPQQELAAVRSCLTEKSFTKGEVLFLEGKCCERVFIVRSGRVKLFRTASSGREQILESLGPGDTCACNPGQAVWFCSTSAQALTPCTVWTIPRHDYVRLVESNSIVARTLSRLFAERLRRMSSLVEDVSLKDAKQRLVKFLLDMLDEKKGKLPKTAVLYIPFTREEIAQRIGTARETVARHLYQLKRAKLIDIKPSQIIIVNQQGLQRLLA